MINEKTGEIQNTEIFLDLNNGEVVQMDMTLSLQMLYDDVMTFVSTALD